MKYTHARAHTPTHTESRFIPLPNPETHKNTEAKIKENTQCQR